MNSLATSLRRAASGTSTILSKQGGVTVQYVARAELNGEKSHLTSPIDRKTSSYVDPVLYPNRWARFKNYVREPSAEFLGTMILMVFGTGVNCQVTLSKHSDVASSQAGSYLSISFGWAVGVALGVWVAGGVSGGHINPAVTLSMAIFRRFPWKKVPIYWVAQTFGALCGSGITYLNYSGAIDIFEGGVGVRSVPGTASLFATYPLKYMTPMSSFINEFIGTFILLFVIFAATDKTSMSPPAGLLPLVAFILTLGIGASLGMQTGYAINPARDLGPRLMTALVGYGKGVFTFGHHYWLWCPIVAPLLGGIFGSFIYDLLLYLGSESPLNRPNGAARHRMAVDSARGELPAVPEVV